ncbi:hypothetical protein EV426DRAFT_610837 [Tirmania nivea]|nr:hypothetical protein EV426DRAFT_610837 [Tirmania nivea]
MIRPLRPFPQISTLCLCFSFLAPIMPNRLFTILVNAHVSGPHGAQAGLPSMSRTTTHILAFERPPKLDNCMVFEAPPT